MTLTRPWAIDAAFPNAADQRKQLAAIYPREGIFPDPITTAAAGIAYAGAGWAVSARAFVAALRRGGAPYSQTYGTVLVGNDGVVAAAWTVGAAPGAGSRIDRLCIRARDTTQGDSAAGTPMDGPGGVQRAGIPEFVVVAGVAGTPGVAPALPAGYQEIAQITVSAGNASAAAAVIAQTYDFAYVAGGPMLFRTTAALLAYTTAANLHDGLEARALDAPLNRYVWSAGAWDYSDVRGTYTPTFSRLTVGNATIEANWERKGKRVRVYGYIKLGSTSSVAAATGSLSVGMSLPFNGAAKYSSVNDAFLAGTVGILDSTIQIYDGFAMFISGVTSEVALYSHGGANGARVPISATSPGGAMGPGDILSFQLEYDMA